MTVTAGIAMLNRWADKLENPQAFYQIHRAEWLELARQVATSTLLALAPDNSQDYQRTVAIAAECISLSMLPLADVSGVAIFLDRTQRTHFDDALSILFAGELSLEEIELYVAAGRAGDPWGKRDFTDDDRKKEDWQIAQNILDSIRNGESAMRQDLIRAFLDRRLGEELGERLPAVLAAWKESFIVRASADWRAYWKK